MKHFFPNTTSIRAKAVDIYVHRLRFGLLSLFILMFSFSAVSNTCANAFPVLGCGVVEMGTTVGEPNTAVGTCVTTQGTGGMQWYTFVGDGFNWTFETLATGGQYDTKIWVFSGACGALVCVTGNDDGGVGTLSLVNFTPTVGVTYYVVVGGFGGAAGNYMMSANSIPCNPLPMVYNSSNCTQSNTYDVDKCNDNVQILGIQVVTSELLNPLDLTQFRLRTDGSTDPLNDIGNIDIYYTGTSATFATTTLFGNAAPLATGNNIFVNGSQALATGTNYFWVVYDLAGAGATTGNNVDALCNRITMSGNNYVPTVQNPSGSRTLLNCLGASCNDGIQNQGENDIDCGGPCAPCPATYTVNGSAFANPECGCYTLTPNVGSQAGSIWNENQLNLNNSFDFTFQLYLGCGGLNGGADGIAFALQPIGTAVGTLGGGMGIAGVNPSLAVTLDTYQNVVPQNDPFQDHIAICSNGDINHSGGVDDLAGPAITPEMEDCAWHDLQVTWDVATLTFSVFYDGAFYLSHTGDIVNDIFGGNPNVFFGFTASGGWAANLQQVCTTVEASYAPSATTACVGEEVIFSDGSNAGGPLVGWAWDFGDGNTGTTSDTANTYATAGTYNVTLEVLDAAGCTDDTLIQVVIIGPDTIIDVQSACGSYTWIDGNNYTANNNTAAFTIIGGSVSGCDSTITLDLTISPAVTSTDVQAACNTFNWIDGSNYTASNSTATHTIVGGSYLGCDSIVTLNLTINTTQNGVDVQTACNTFNWIDGNNYTANNSTATHTIIGGAANGCDSIVTLNLTLNPAVTSTDVKVACNTFNWIDGNNYTASNSTATHTIVGGAVSGCDSIITLNLTINTTQNGVDVQTACNTFNWIDGNSYTANNSTATHTIIGGAANGCDSIVTLNLTLDPAVTSTDLQVACNTFNWIDGNNYIVSNSTATHTIVGGAVSGCDSIITLNLTINTTQNGVDVQTACNTFNWIDGNNYTANNSTATHTIIGGAANGCDSIVTLNLTINTTQNGVDVQTACNTFSWIDGNSYTASNNTATHTIVGGSYLGCDSIVTLNLTINNTVTSTDAHIVCGSYLWIDGNNYAANNNTATFTIVGGAATGCDSIVTLDLTINTFASSIDPHTACDAYAWIDGNSYTVSNNTATFTIVGGSYLGCDSIVNLDLTINYTVNSTDVQVACDTYNWIDGNNYLASNNTATHTIIGGAVTGCDSIVTLDLTINYTVNSTDVQTACNTYTWIDGNNYTASNNTATHTIVGGSSLGCDSIITLDLTINYTVNSTDIQTACNTYTWIDGNNYTTSNNAATHTIVGGATTGCDSIVTLDLIMNYTVSSTDPHTACNSYTWIDGNNYTASNNAATHTIVGGTYLGCDSIVTLDLTINLFASSTDTHVECTSLTWIDGVTYPASNNTATFTIVGGSYLGCDSIVTLDLTIPPAIVLNTNGADAHCLQSDGAVGVTASGGTIAVDYTYLWTNAAGNPVGTTANVTNLPAGAYTILVTDDIGCTSTTTVTINDLPAGTVTAVVSSYYNGADISCNGACDGEITITMNGGFAPFTFNVNGTAQPGTVIPNLCAGNYPITVIDNFGCIANTNVVLSEPTPVTATTIIVHEVCINDCNGNIAQNGSGGTGAYTYSFDNGSNYGTVNNLGSLCAGNYNLVTMDANGCTFDLTVQVDPGAVFSDATIDPSGPHCIDVTPLTLNAANTGGIWSGTGIANATTGVFDPAVAGAGTHIITYTLAGACGDVQTENIMVNPLPTISFLADNLQDCAPLSTNFANTGTIGNCIWTFGDGNTVLGCGSIAYNYANPGSYSVSLTVVDGNGCGNSDTAINYINVYANPIADFTYGPQPTSIYDPNINFTDQSWNAAQWQWNFSDLGNSTQEHPSFDFINAGSYEVGLLVTTLNGCTDSTTNTVIIGDEADVFVPNSFTPDGDGLNDYFFPVLKGFDAEGYTFMVFDRWGELLFKSSSLSGRWDGTYKGEPVHSGVYIWKLKATAKGIQKEESRTGHVNLLK